MKILPSKWKTEDGKEIHIHDMSDSHLKNCAIKIARERWRLDWLPFFITELKLRGLHDIAAQAEKISLMNEALL